VDEAAARANGRADFNYFDAAPLNAVPRLPMDHAGERCVRERGASAIGTHSTLFVALVCVSLSFCLLVCSF
jgi:hypothetical protein